MSRELHEYFLQSPGDNYVNLSTRLQPPLEVQFNVHSFGDKREKLDREERTAWSKLRGIDAYLEFKMVGFAVGPAPFVDQKVELLVNPLGTRHDLANAERGVLGDGRHQHSSFLVRLWLPPTVTRELLDHVASGGRRYTSAKTAGELLLDWQQDPRGWRGDQDRLDLIRAMELDIQGGEDPGFIPFRVDLCDVVYQERPQWTSFSVCRIYS